MSLYMYPSMPCSKSLCRCLCLLARLSLLSRLLRSLLSCLLTSCSSAGAELDSWLILAVTECHSLRMLRVCVLTGQVSAQY